MVFARPRRYNSPIRSSGRLLPLDFGIFVTRYLALFVIAIVLSGGLALALQDENDEMKETAEKNTNRLVDSLSPYLLQHAHNPVDWYPWGAEALAKATRENKPIFLSIGYSACHWCHVMEHECFEVDEVAALLNEHYVSIKVDREERPDIDEIYMQATLALNRGNGGWPMSVFLTPDRVPFWAGTYIPRDNFMALLEEIAKAWAENRENIDQVARQLQGLLDRWARGPDAAEGVAGVDLVHSTARSIAQAFDPQRGGMRSQGNKFPPSMAMDLMLRAHAVTDDKSLLAAVEVTLDNMSDGGIYDHLGGGICRYSTDPQWLVPHFEKMLYDQALVSGIYLDGYQVFDKQRYAEVARGIFDYVIEDLQSPEGGFYSTRDADSEGLEGKYYIWTIEQVRDVLGAEDAKVFCAYYDVTETGNWHERLGHAPPGPKNILNVKRDLQTVASEHSLSASELAERLTGMRAKMLEMRRKRVPPGLDDKILTAWNGLMIASLAKGARVLDEPRYARAASRAAEFVLQNLRRDGRLLRTFRNGESRLTGYLNDYAFLIEGLLNLYEATFDVRWLVEAEALADACHKYYFDPAAGGFFLTANDAEALIARSKNPADGAIPSGNSVHALNLMRLAIFLGRNEFRSQAESIFKALGRSIESSPVAFERLLCALDFYHGTTKEIALAAGADGQAQPLVRTVYSRYLPNKVVAAVTGGAASAKMPLLKGKTAIGGKATAYVCENYACKRPVQTRQDLEALLWPDPPAK